MCEFKTKVTKIARISPGETLQYRDMDIAWLMDCHMVHEQGLTVFRPPSSTYIPSISEPEYLQSVRGILPQFEQSARRARHKGYQSYIILSFCRNLYALKHKRQISKYGGAQWASRQYPEWAELINNAVAWHGLSDKSESLGTQKQTIKFAQFALTEAENL